MDEYIIINPADNVAVALVTLPAGQRLPGVLAGTLRQDIPAGHKFALRDIEVSHPVVKYGHSIGHAILYIRAGEWVHTHNLKTSLEGEIDYQYQPAAGMKAAAAAGAADQRTFRGFVRENGKVGIRNEIWVVPTVGCVNRLAERLAAQLQANLPEGVEAAVAFPHPYGCSQLGEDHENTRRILANLALHPNAGGIFYVGLGCENNTVASFRELVQSDPESNPNIAYMIAQEEVDEFAAGMEQVRKLAEVAAKAKRTEVPVSELKVGLKCGGSDGLSGITANPLLGLFSDWLVDRGGSTVLSEVPEMFGAEVNLLNRTVDKEVFANGVDMINNFKHYFESYGQTIYENPSPGNKAGGISTLEDKSLGCTQKGGSRAVVDVLPYGGVLRKAGLSLLYGPGNDIVACSLLAAAGVQMVLFTTGRGTPLGGPVPVVKVASNHDLAVRKAGWIDFDASPIITGEKREAVLARFVDHLLEVCSGRLTRSELSGARDFAIFKDGVTL